MFGSEKMVIDQFGACLGIGTIRELSADDLHRSVSARLAQAAFYRLASISRFFGEVVCNPALTGAVRFG